MPIDPTFVPDTLDFNESVSISEPFQDFGVQSYTFDNARLVDVGYPTNNDPHQYFTPVTLSIPMTGQTAIPADPNPYFPHPLLGADWTAEVSTTTDKYGTPSSLAGPIGSLGLVNEYPGKRLKWGWLLTFGDGTTWSRTVGWTGSPPDAYRDNGDTISVSQGIGFLPNGSDPLWLWIVANAGTTASYSGTLTLQFEIDAHFLPLWKRWAHDGSLVYTDLATYTHDGKTYQRTECLSQFRWYPYPANSPPYVDYPLDGFLYTVDLAYLIHTIDTAIIWAWGHTTPPSTDASPPARDEYKDIVATAWFGAAAAGVKPLYVSILRAPQKNIGSGSGSTAGEDTYTYSTSIDERSDVALVYLPNGDLCMYYDTYSGDDHQEVRVINHQYGIGPAGNWSAPVNVTPNVPSRWKSTGRGQNQGFRFRVGK